MAYINGKEILFSASISEYAGKQEQEKTAVVTESGQEILPDDGYVLSKVTVELNVNTVKRFIELRDAIGLFYGCSTLNSETLFNAISYEETSSATSMENMFTGCTLLTSIPMLDSSNVTSMAYMFSNCRNLSSFPQLNTSKVVHMNNMFNLCVKLETIPMIDTSLVQSMNNMFYNCNALKSIPQLNTGNVTKIGNMFRGCNSLTSIPELNTVNVTLMDSLFYACTSLSTVTTLDMRSVTSAKDMFTDCSSLLDITLKNIKVNLTIGSGTSYGHLLSLNSLIGVIGELIDTGSTKTLTIGTANLEKIANVYVKLITITDEMRAADEFIDSKLPFEVCESTDDGAMLMKDYVTRKNWSLL